MSRKAPLSFDDKKAKLLQLFHEKLEFYQLKDLEKIAPKEKGIVANSIKDVIQALVDDGVVDTDKIGGSVYFWSFPSKTMNLKKRTLENLESTYESSTKKLKLISDNVTKAEASKGNDDETERAVILEEIEDLRRKKTELETKLNAFKGNDPKILEKMQSETQVLKEAANRWTDNVFEVKSWCKRKFAIEDQVLNKQFGIPEDLDYVS